MKLFSQLYDWVMKYVGHQHAPKYLAALSFSESMFFPIPPDVMLAPMSLANTHKAWRFALITTVASIFGGVCGYLLGMLFFEPLIEPLLMSWGYMPQFEHAIQWFDSYGIWVIFLAGFSPIPYKVFTISAGLLQMAFVPFIFASAVGRGLRFYLVAGLMVLGGEKMEQNLRKYIDLIGWITVLLAVILYLVFR